MELRYCEIFLGILMCSYVMAFTAVTDNRYDDMTNMIELHGYPVESHEVRTKDGYFLKMHRIPRKTKSASGLNVTAIKLDDNKVSPPVFIMHGLMCSDAIWTIPGPGKALAYILSDAGYDVWMGNARGTTYSKKNVYHGINTKEFWDFSWHEIGIYDLPAMIDYVLKKTNSSGLHYIGHSQGWTTLMVMLSMLPERNQKIISAHGLAPVAFLGNVHDKFLKDLAAHTDDIKNIILTLGLYEILPTSPLFKMIGKILCDDTTNTQELCVNAFFTIVGFNSDQLNRTILPDLFEHLPAGISWKQLVHFGQLIQSKRFQMYDYRSQPKNIQVYGLSRPPQYNLDNIEIPMTLYYGTGDKLLVPEDAERFAKKMKKYVYRLTRIQGWNHADFFMAVDANKVIFRSVIEDIKKANAGRNDINTIRGIGDVFLDSEI